MASFVFNEETLINDAIFKYEEKLNSPLNRFLDKSPTFVTYFHIDNENTTADAGFIDTENIIGDHSSLRFNKIEKFPIYGLEAIMLQLNDEDQGLDSTYEGEATIVPSTIKPYPNDFFIINHLKDIYLFRVKNIEYDNIRPDGYTKIDFRLEDSSSELYNKLLNQCTTDYTCVYNNIGTDTKCIIKTDEYKQYRLLNEIYYDMVQTYVAAFYSEKYNCFIGHDDTTGDNIYDPLMSKFIDKHGLINRNNSYSAIVLSDQFSDTKRDFKYEKSVYKFIEKPDKTRINQFRYQLLPGTNYHQSNFYRWDDQTIKVVDIPALICANDLNNFIFSNEFIDTVIHDKPTTMGYETIIKKYINGSITSLGDIPLDIKETMIALDTGIESFFCTPLVLYIMKKVVSDVLNRKNENPV